MRSLVLRSLLLGLALALAPPAPARAQEDAPAEETQPPPSYQPLIDGAVAEFAAGRWAEARALFRSAHDAYPNARTLRGIGMAAYEMRDYPSAVRALAASLADARRALTDEQRAQVGDLLTRARAFVGRFVVPAAPAGSRLYLDGTGADVEGDWPAADGELLVGVGAHEVTIRGDAGRTARARIVVRGHEDGPLDIDLAPLADPAVTAAVPDAPPPHAAPAAAPVDRAPRASDPLPWIVAGASGAVLVAGAIVLGGGLSDRASVEGAPIGTEWADLQGAYGRSGPLVAAGAVLLGVGTGAALVGIAWGALAGSGEESPATALHIDVGLGSLAIGGTF